MEELQHLHESGVKVKAKAILPQVRVPANSFSAVVTVKAEKLKHVISVGFAPKDGERHNVYPVLLEPNTGVSSWKVCFFNTEAAEVIMTIFGVESN